MSGDTWHLCRSAYHQVPLIRLRDQACLSSGRLPESQSASHNYRIVHSDTRSNSPSSLAAKRHGPRKSKKPDNHMDLRPKISPRALSPGKSIWITATAHGIRHSLRLGKPAGWLPGEQESSDVLTAHIKQTVRHLSAGRSHLHSQEQRVRNNISGRTNTEPGHQRCRFGSRAERTLA